MRFQEVQRLRSHRALLKKRICCRESFHVYFHMTNASIPLRGQLNECSRISVPRPACFLSADACSPLCWVPGTGTRTATHCGHLSGSTPGRGFLGTPTLHTSLRIFVLKTSRVLCGSRPVLGSVRKATSPSLCRQLCSAVLLPRARTSVGNEDFPPVSSLHILVSLSPSHSLCLSLP